MNWLSIEMVEINHRRIETKRDYVGLDADAVRGGIMHPSSVDEAVNRMRALEKQVKQFREIQAQTQSRGQGQTQAEDDMSVGGNGAEDGNENENEEANTSAPKIPPHRMGRVVHRSEPDLKTHTSYLVFAILPQEWTEEDEKRCRQIWPSGSLEESEQTQKSNKQIKREKRAKAKQEQGGSRLE